MLKQKEGSRHREICKYITGLDFSGELKRIAQEHNVTAISLRFMVERIFESPVFRYQFEHIKKEQMFNFIGFDKSVTIQDLLTLEKAVTRLNDMLPIYDDGQTIQCEQDAQELFDNLDGDDKLTIVNLISEASEVVSKIKAVKVLENRG